MSCRSAQVVDPRSGGPEASEVAAAVLVRHNIGVGTEVVVKGDVLLKNCHHLLGVLVREFSSAMALFTTHVTPSAAQTTARTQVTMLLCFDIDPLLKASGSNATARGRRPARMLLGVACYAGATQ